MFIVIPAYRPDDRLFGVIDGLVDDEHRFVVVDDGSGPAYASLFRRLEKDYSHCVTVIHHSLNRGKGHAMKTAFEHIQGICGEDDGILTIDADSLNRISDASVMTAAWEKDHSAFYIGSCKFTGDIPLRDRIGSTITRSVFAVTSGVRISDTESGLRAFSVKLIPDLLKIKGERYDFEIAELLYAVKERIKIVEIPFETEYVPGRHRQRFNFRDSWLIYRMIFVFMLSSFSCFLIDYSLLLVLASVFKRLPGAVEVASGEFRLPLFGMQVDTHLLALIIARTVSSFCNYLLNRKVVFKTSGKAAIIKFYIVIIGLLIANYALLALVASENGLPLWIAQLVVQAVLYPFSFILQRKFVFPDKNAGAKRTGSSETVIEETK